MRRTLIASRQVQSLVLRPRAMTHASLSDRRWRGRGCLTHAPGGEGGHLRSHENDHYVGDMEAVADGDVVYFDRVNPVALDALGSLQISKAHRTGAHGPTVLRVLGDVAAQCSRGCVKTFKAVFIEEKGMVELGMKGRRHSGRLHLGSAPGTLVAHEAAVQGVVDVVCLGHVHHELEAVPSR